ncbi:IS605 OrfB family transposase [Hydrogenivirga caldilitoris]|uniref:IS605 OrfB family transposase n=1 Tax=Hydrogenivirga caldilitoris TaxID=246264 RepID=A0A497XQL5_9AQUI|nr:RNA-guided endonuclease TnpB family protein [Hydrogenivirga caldilitoris]RLJ70429.1 IS605 OrfB family transposase [Hydrogenivirga caldilitoris]
MSSGKRVLSIRVSGRERKRRVRTLLLDLAHFRNMLIILIREYYLLHREHLLNQSLLYGLVAKNYSCKYREELEKVLRNIEDSRELKEFLERLKAQKEKIDNPHYVQYVIRQVIKDFRSFFKSLECFRANPEKLREMPRLSKPKKLRYLINFSVEGNANTFKQEEDRLVIRLRNGKYLKVKLPKDFPYRVSSVRLKLFGDDLYVDVVYEQEVKGIEPKGDYRAGIDIGLDEMLSVVSENPEIKSFIVSGKEIKAFNQWFNKERAKLRSQMDYLKNEIRSGDYEDVSPLKKKLRELEIKEKVLSAQRKRWMENNLYKIARKLVDLLYKTGHKIIYIGKNAIESKNGIDLGKKTNREFVSIPFRRLVELIKYKAEELRMEVVEVDESYTSKTSPFADILKVQELGSQKFEEEDETKRKELEKEISELRKGSRSGNVFKDKVLGKVFHADLVGALNILRAGAKLLRLSFYENLRVLFTKLCNPVRFKLVDFLYLQVSPESLLGIGGSKQGVLIPAGWMEKQGYLDRFEI